MLTSVFAHGDLVIDGSIVRGDVVVVDGHITEIGDDLHQGVGGAASNGDDPIRIVDCTGRIIAPGFIDLQCNGAVGHDITARPESIVAVAAALPRFGVTSFCPTVVTSARRQRRAAIEEMLALGRARSTGADPIGLHFEGPMISPRHLGAHPAKHVGSPSSDELEEWIASGVVGMVTLAPELPGATEIIGRLSAAGIVVSAGHTAMSPTDLVAARAEGLTYATHLFNAMAPFRHRAPGPIGAVLADRVVVAGLIADGIHVDPVAVRMAWNALGPQRLSLVSDAVGALGMPYGRLDVAGFEIVYDETGVRTRDGVLAGSALPLDQAVRNLIAWTGCSLCEALATVTTTPADLLGLTDRGRIAVGGRADLVVLDDTARLVDTIVGGRSFTAGDV